METAVSFTPQYFYQPWRNCYRYYLDRWQVGPEDGFGRCGGEKTYYLCRELTLVPWSIPPLALLLHRHLYTKA